MIVVPGVFMLGRVMDAQRGKDELRCVIEEMTSTNVHRGLKGLIHENWCDRLSKAELLLGEPPISLHSLVEEMYSTNVRRGLKPMVFNRWIEQLNEVYNLLPKE